jgi:membrane protein involved in colicin uptake
MHVEDDSVRTVISSIRDGGGSDALESHFERLMSADEAAVLAEMREERAERIELERRDKEMEEARLRHLDQERLQREAAKKAEEERLRKAEQDCATSNALGACPGQTHTVIIERRRSRAHFANL